MGGAVLHDLRPGDDVNVDVVVDEPLAASVHVHDDVHLHDHVDVGLSPHSSFTITIASSRSSA